MSPILCVPACWTPTQCPECGSDLPPRGRAIPLEWNIPSCCDDARMAITNDRHLWNKGEAADYAEMIQRGFR